MNTKKITLATIKSFVRKNDGNLHINVESNFDGMVDCVMPVNGGYTKAEPTGHNLRHTLGILGAWFVGQSRDYFTAWEDETMTGYNVYNCCGSFVLAVEK